MATTRELAAATCSARRRVAHCRSAAGTAWLIRPHSAAARAGTISPVSSICMARLRPMARVRATIGVVQKSPILTPGVAKAASSAAMARSQVATSWHPAALGFLIYNFPPAKSFMGDCGANLLGLMMGVIAVEAAVKTAAGVFFVLPLILLAVPFLDTTFVVIKRLKYKQPIYRPDSEHFHHRMARIGFSSRRTIAYLYAWTLMLAGLALARKFVPYSDHKGHYDTGWTLVIIALGLVVVGASVYLVYVLEILKFRRLDAIRLRHLRPEASPAEIDMHVTKHLETGEFQALAQTGKGEVQVLDDAVPGGSRP